MFDSSYSKSVVADFRGSWSAREETDIPSQRAAYAQNVQYAEGRVLTRYGYANVFQPNDVVGSMYNWIYADPLAGEKNFLVWFANSPSPKLRYANLASPSATDIYTESGAVTASVVSAGARLITTQLGADGLGRGHGRVLFFNAGALTADNLFARPMLTTEVTVTPSFGAGGNVTPGLHEIAFILETRTGFVGRYSPAANDANLTVVPATSTVSAANRTGTITIAPGTAWPAYAARVRLIAKTVTNRSKWYFVPGATATVTPGSGIPAVLSFNISDSDLAIVANDASRYQFLVTQTNASAAPFSPIAAFEAGSRVGYIVNDAAYGQCVFFSDENNYQALNTAFSIYYLPQQKQITAAFSLGAVSYLLGPNWTYAAVDSGGYPSSWAGARQIDQAIGTVSPLGVSVNVALGAAWVASKAGLYRFQGGQYDTLPVSWRNAEYARINWAAGSAVQVVDDAATKRVRVIAPLDASTAPDYILTWDYTRGTSPDKVDFSLDSLGGSLSAHAGCVVQNSTTKKLEFWLGPGSGSQNFRRQMNSSDATPFRDDASTGIASTYRTGPILGPGRPRLSHHHGATLRVRGAGAISLSVKSLDNADTFAATDVTGSASPGVAVDRPVDLIAEDAKWEVSNAGSADSYFDLSSITHYSSTFSEQR